MVMLSTVHLRSVRLLLPQTIDKVLVYIQYGGGVDLHPSIYPSISLSSLLFASLVIGLNVVVVVVVVVVFPIM